MEESKPVEPVIEYKPTRIIITPEEKAEISRKQREALPANATWQQKIRANLVPARKGEGLSLGTKHPKQVYIKDIANKLLGATKIDMNVTYADGRPNRHIKFDASDSFRHVLVATLISRGMKGDISAIKELLDRTEGKVVQTVADVTQHPFCIVTGEEQPIDIIEETKELSPSEGDSN